MMDDKKQEEFVSRILTIAEELGCDTMETVRVLSSLSANLLEFLFNDDLKKAVKEELRKSVSERLNGK